MKKILFRKILLDCLFFFLITLFSTSIIIWVFQAVNFLDIIVEDGRDFGVYLGYSLTNFPKIVSKILPFAIFFSFCYVLNRYELNNEMIIFWNFGINKVELIVFFIKFSILIMIFQLILTTIIVPNSQNYSRFLIKSSSVDFFESFIKPKKFNDNIRGLTIYAEEKSFDGTLKNIYLKKDNSNSKYQITVAKTGEFKNMNKSKILVLYDGQTINVINNKVTNFNFTKSDFILSQFDTDVIIQDKIQETSTLAHLYCIEKNYKLKIPFLNQKSKVINPNCTVDNLRNIFQELYKRFIVPIFIPILIIISLLLILNPKEKISYNKNKILIFLFGFLLIIFSESSIKFIDKNIQYNAMVSVLPILIALVLYSLIRIKLRVKT
mgnify:FL=1